MAFTLTSNTGSGSGSTAISIGTVTAGDLVVAAVVNTTGTQTLTSVVDDHGLSFNSVVAAVAGTTLGFVWGNPTVSGANHLTLTWNGGITDGLAYGEFTGSSVTGVTQDGTLQLANPASTVTNVVTPTYTTTAADDLVLNAIYNNSSTPTYGTPWSTVISAFPIGMCYQADVAAGTYTPNGTVASGGFCASACLALTAGGGPTLTVRLVN